MTACFMYVKSQPREGGGAGGAGGVSLAPRRQEIWLLTSKVAWLRGAERCYHNQQTIHGAEMRKKEGRCLFFSP